jgi:hypothetical protein
MAAAADKPPGFASRLWALLASAIRTRLFFAATATGTLAFAAQSWIAPSRLPPFGALPLADLGLASPIPQPNLLPEVREQLDKAVAAGTPYAQDAMAALLAGDPQLLAALNWVGLGVCGGLWLAGLLAQSAQARDATIANRWWAPKAG